MNKAKTTEIYARLMNLKRYMDNAPNAEIKRKNVKYLIDVLLQIIEEK